MIVHLWLAPVFCCCHCHMQWHCYPLLSTLSLWQDWWQLYKRPVIFVLYKACKLYPLSNMGGWEYITFQQNTPVRPHVCMRACAPYFILYFLWHIFALLEPSSRKYSSKDYNDMWINIFITEFNSCIPPSTRYCCTRHKLYSSNSDLICTHTHTHTINIYIYIYIYMYVCMYVCMYV